MKKYIIFGAIIFFLIIVLIILIIKSIKPTQKNWLCPSKGQSCEQNDCDTSNEKCFTNEGDCKKYCINPPEPSPISIDIVKKAPKDQGMFKEKDYSSIKNLNDIASYNKGSIPDNFKKFYDNYLTKNGDLISFITKSANNQDWSPDPVDLKNKIEKGEVYLKLQQVAYILANFILGNNTRQNNIIERKVGGNRTFYSSGDSTFQLSSYFSAMYFWMQEKELDRIIVCYAKISSKDSDMPPIKPNGSTNVSYKCVNSLADYPENTIRLVYGASNPGGSYMNDSDQARSAQEESAFKMYPELAIGMFILPDIAGNTSTSPIKGWIVLGTRTYNKLLPIGNSITLEMGEPKQLDSFANVDNNYKIAKGGILGLSARTCNAPGKNYCNAGKGCGDCWRKVPSDLNLLYDRAYSCFNVNKWPENLSKIANSLRMVQTWKLLGGRWGSGAWGCNPSYSLFIQGLAACNGNWKDLTLCGTSQETSGGKCVCQQEGEWNDEIYTKVYNALQQEFNKNLWKCN